MASNSNSEEPLRQLPKDEQIEWRPACSLNFGRTDNPCLVEASGNVYCGGGYAVDPADKEKVSVYSYCATTSKWSWSVLLHYDYHYFSMLLHNSQLFLIGGCTRPGHNKSGVVSVWDFTQKSLYSDTYPPMKTPCSSPSVVSHNEWIIAAGGYKDGDVYTDRVELLHTGSCIWYQAVNSPLPGLRNGMTTAVIGDTWYLLGGYGPDSGTATKKVLYINLETLVKQVTLQHESARIGSSSPAISLWETLPAEVPLKWSTALAHDGSLLAIGGCNGSGEDQASSAIHRYVNGEWKRLRFAELPMPRYQCGCVVLCDGTIFVVGGTGVKVNKDEKQLATVVIGV